MLQAAWVGPWERRTHLATVRSGDATGDGQTRDGVRMRDSGTLASQARDTREEMRGISDVAAAGAVPCPVIPR